jgi:hypothetical protein
MYWAMEPASPDESQLELSEPALAEFLGEGTVSDAIARNELRAFLIDRRINVSRDEFERWVRQLADEGRKRAREAQLGLRCRATLRATCRVHPVSTRSARLSTRG